MSERRGRTCSLGRRLGLAAALLAAMLAGGSFALGSSEVAAHPAERELADDLLIRVLAPGVWVHRSFEQLDGHRIAANGLLVAADDFALLIDTGWRPEQTRRLLEWAASTVGKPVEHVILTHAHADRSGGLAAISADDAIVQAHASTAARLADDGRAVDWTFEFQETLDLGGEKVVLFYPGAGHAPDNIIVWLPRRGVLFGGCLIRPSQADDLGNTGDADLASWSAAVRRVIRTFRDTRIVVPGHGAPGGVELLSHTMDLIEAATIAADGE